MALGRPWRALVGWFGHLVGRERQTWVEPGNAITRAVLSGAALALPDLPVRRNAPWVETGDEVAVPVVQAPSGSPTAGPAGEGIPAPAPEGDSTPGRWRAA